MNRELSRAERLFGLVIAAIIGLGAIAALLSAPSVSSEEDCGLLCWCWHDPSRKYLTCGVRE